MAQQQSMVVLVAQQHRIAALVVVAEALQLCRLPLR
jgi:hypothetical protein